MKFPPGKRLWLQIVAVDSVESQHHSAERVDREEIQNSEDKTNKIIIMTKRRKGSRSGFDYATYSENRGFHRGAAAAPYYGAYTMTPYYPPTTPYHPIYNGYLNSG